MAAHAGGRVLREWSNKFTVSEKGPADLVTEADLASQQVIFDIVSRRFPDHVLLGEEGSGPNTKPSNWRWIIDPLDGTSNYVHGFPYYAVSVGVECDGELVAGVVYDPCHDETFSATLGGGAFLNGKPMRVSRFEPLRQAMCIASFPTGVSSDSPAVARFLRVLPHAQAVHRSGSAAMNLSLLAAGRLDGFWSTSLKPWDMAAGVLLVQEAGGRVTQINGLPFEIDQPNILSSNGTCIHGELVSLLTTD
jgi:myo-inositol-1(or 4)-monophosphatase